MLSAFQKNIPPHFNLLSSTEQYNPKADMTSGEEYPTLLHWAARFGLERVCWQLLECPGGGAAVALRNVRHRTPAELARDHKHNRLADMLADHLKINEFSNMYYYLKNMSDNDKEDGEDEGTNDELCIVETTDTVDSPTIESKDSENEVFTDPFSEACTQNLEDTSAKNNEKKPRPNLKLPKVKEQFYQNDFPLHAHDSTVDRIQQAIEHDYLVQPSNIKVESPKFRPNNLYANSSRLLPQQSDIFLYSPTEESKIFNIDTPTSDISQVNLNAKDIRNSGSVKSGKDATGQEELAEIINDFKNNVFTISEVEKLVMEWRNRNETQQSLKEKQEQLNKMREEYDKIQQKINDNLKRPTPFERVKKMFSKSKNKHHDNNTGTIEKRSGNTRPNSSLSDSSSSSGRLSTVSGGSVGETNSVQSELDDKARSIISASTLTMNSCDSDNRLDDYLIPPPPRPLNGCPQFTTFGHPKHENRSQHMATIVEREASASRERLDCDSDTNSTHLRLNFTARDRSVASRCDDRDGAHMYMNISATHS